jgi:hypothetical protein
MLSLLPLLLSTATIGAPVAPRTPYSLLESPARHVRTIDKRVQRLLVIGVARSGTFASLMEQMNASDVIVYIEPTQTLPTTLAGRLLLMPLAGGQRYLRIQVAVATGPDDMIAVIAHELRHAVEVADDPTVRNESDLAKLYERIGRRSGFGHCYETEAAQDAARVVRRELVA